jgi:hypothetical protein
MQATCSYGTSVAFQRTTRRYIQDIALFITTAAITSDTLRDTVVVLYPVSSYYKYIFLLISSQLVSNQIGHHQVILEEYTNGEGLHIILHFRRKLYIIM